jgi:ubiquinol-cytochrome c reductase cytochrome c1 subunit
MKKLIAAFLLSVAPAAVMAAGGEVHLDSANVNLRDQASLQRGAEMFVQYCMGCHSAKYARYGRVGEDIGMSPDEVKYKLMLHGGKPGDQMTVPLSEADAEKYFGTVVPDLTLTARLRGEDWVYTYLRSFYVDEKRPLGVNNMVFPDVGMPHVLADLQGLQKAVFKEEKDKEGNPHKVFQKFRAGHAWQALAAGVRCGGARSDGVSGVHGGAGTGRARGAGHQGAAVPRRLLRSRLPAQEGVLEGRALTAADPGRVTPWIAEGARPQALECALFLFRAGPF